MSIFSFSFAAWVLGGLGMHLSSRRVDSVERRARWIKFAVYFAIMNGVLWIASFGGAAFTALVSIIVAVGLYELYRVRATFAAWPVFAVAAAGSIAFARMAMPGEATFVYLMVALFDGYSQIFGQLLGRRRLSPSISPSKTIEGALGGAAATIASAGIVGNVASLDWPFSALAAFMIVVAALAGDLGASWVKRKAGMKDFGNLLPGHGGVLDRFDSFLFAASGWWVILQRAA